MLELAAFESRRRARGALVLGVGLGLFALFTLAFYPSVEATGPALDEYLANLPPSLREAFGLESLTTVGGFLAGQFYQFAWVLLLGLYFAYRGGGLVAADVESGRMDTLLATPISRSRMVLEKAASLLVPLVVANVVTAVAVLGGLAVIGESLALDRLVAVHALSVPYLAACAGIGLVLSVGTRRTDLAQRAGLAAVVGLFLVESVASASDYGWLGVVSPTRHFDPADVLVRGEFDLAGAAVLLAGTAALLAVAVLWFRRVDVR